MEPFTTQHKPIKRESKFKNWLTSLFCIREEKPIPMQIGKRSERFSKMKQKQKIYMSLLGTYKCSIICKISRKNFIVNQYEMDHGRLPPAISKYLGDKLNSSTVVIQGEISNKVTKKIPYILKVIAPGEKAVGECIQSNMKNLKLRVTDLCIFRPKFPSSRPPAFLQADQSIGKEIQIIANKFRNSMIILPKDTVLDEIGFILSSVSKFVEVETIVANGGTLCIVVYIGSKEFVLISQNQQIDFVVKQLSKDLTKQDPCIYQLVRKIYQRSSISQVLSILMISINQAIVDTIFSCFLRNAVSKDLLTNIQVGELFPNRISNVQIIRTPSLAMTARFNFTTSENFKRSCSDDMLNGQNGQLIFQNEIETLEETELSMQGLEIVGEYNPY